MIVGHKDELILIAKKAIEANSTYAVGEDEIIALDGNDIDHIAEQVAEDTGVLIDANYFTPKQVCDMIATAQKAEREQTATNIADWINYRAARGCYGEIVTGVMVELATLIRKNYGVEQNG